MQLSQEKNIILWQSLKQQVFNFKEETHRIGQPNYLTSDEGWERPSQERFKKTINDRKKIQKIVKKINSTQQKLLRNS